MSKKTNSGLLEYCKLQIGKPYWWGTFGQISTPQLLTTKRRQFSNTSYYADYDFINQMGVRVHDCVGLIKGYLFSETPTSVPLYNATQDRTAAGYYEKANVKGQINTFPKHSGMLLFRGVSPTKITHVGVYDAAGYVHHAKGHRYGVVTEAYNPKDWQFWCQCVWIEDDTANETKVEPKKDFVDTSTYPLIKKGCTGAYVQLAQQALNLRGNYGLDEDSDFGILTENAVKDYQRKTNCKFIDGIIGQETWYKLFH